MAHIITIGRQLAAGGRTIGKYVAERLGIPYYDSELIRLAAEKKGIDSAVMAANEEKSSFFSGVVTGSPAGCYYPIYNDTVKDAVFAAQSEVIRELADQPCVIVGRCSEQILKGKADLTRVFLYAGLKARVARLTAMYGEVKRPEWFLKKADKQRALYYSSYTGEMWGIKDHYDLMINTTQLTTEQSGEVIIALYKGKK